MNRNLIAFFIFLVMFMQGFSVANWIELARACQNDMGFEIENAGKLSSQLTEEDASKEGKLMVAIFDHPECAWLIQGLLNNKRISVDNASFSKGYKMIYLPPPNWLV